MLELLDRKETELLELFSQNDLQRRIKEIAEQINNDFSNEEELYVISILKGAVLFSVDLVKSITIPSQIEFIRLASYGNDENSSGRVKPVDLSLPNLEGKNVLIVEDIIDTGLTMEFLVKYIKAQLKPKNLKIAVLLDKHCARTHHVDVDYVGFPIDNKFVVGYGLDYKGFYRNLPYIGYFPQ
ncbi:MAG: hypoxanthine phosphoribosyltransferase [Candidatus Gastranaerophilales bacterium]|nr:hypoxanthine phosphoribosyltransferase [Candidatus Gastranaerophilales bacterium]